MIISLLCIMYLAFPVITIVMNEMLISGVSQGVVNCTTMNPFIRDVVLYDG